jgi:hypothetical protein
MQRGREIRMGDAEKISIDVVEAMQRDFDALPRCPVEKVSRADAVRRLVPQIRAMRSKGYSFAMIVELFAERGVRVSEASLAGYLKQARRRSEKKKSVALPSAEPKYRRETMPT